MPIRRSARPMSLLAVGLGLGLWVSAAQAHDLWVNAMSSGNAGPDGAPVSVVVTSVGWGHAPLPIAEFLPAARISAYRVVAPDGAAMALPFDPEANASVSVAAGDAESVSLQAGDALVRRLVLRDAAPRGAWRVHLANPPAPRTTWIDAEGVQRAAAVLPDEVEGAQRIIASAVSVRDATAWWVHGAWAPPEPAGAALELLPGADPTALRPGDTLAVQLYRNGAPVEGMALFTAFGAGAAEADIAETGAGQAAFTLPEAGPWVLRGMLDVPVAEAGAEFAAFEGRIDTIRFITTLAVTVGP